MRCEDIQDRLTDYLSGGLTKSVEETVRVHLDECPVCQREAQQLQAAWDGLGQIPTRPADSNAMRARFASMLAGFEHGQEVQESARVTARPKTERWWPQAFLQLAAALVLFALGALVGRDRAIQPPAGPSEDIVALREELRDMRQMLTLSLLRQEWATERLQGVTWSSRIDNPGGEVVDVLIETLMHDPNVNVRLAVVDSLSRLAGHQRVRDGAVQALATAESPLVQVALIDVMVELEEGRSVETLRRLSADASVPEAVRLRAAWGLGELEPQS